MISPNAIHILILPRTWKAGPPNIFFSTSMPPTLIILIAVPPADRPWLWFAPFPLAARAHLDQMKTAARAPLHREFGAGFYTMLGIFGPRPRAVYHSNDVNLVVEQVIDDAIRTLKYFTDVHIVCLRARTRPDLGNAAILLRSTR